MSRTTGRRHHHGPRVLRAWVLFFVAAFAVLPIVGNKSVVVASQVTISANPTTVRVGGSMVLNLTGDALFEARKGGDPILAYRIDGLTEGGGAFALELASPAANTYCQLPCTATVATGSVFRQVSPSTEPLSTTQVCNNNPAYLRYIDMDNVTHTLPVELTERCRTLSGHVYDAEGNPMANVPIWIEPQTDFDWNGFTHWQINPNHFPNGRAPIIHYAALGFVARTDASGFWSAVVPNFADDFMYGRTWPGFCAGGGAPFNWLDCGKFRGYAVAPFSGLSFPIYTMPKPPAVMAIERGDGVEQQYEDIIMAERGDTLFYPRYRDSIFVESGDRSGLDFYGLPDLRVIARTAPDLETPGVLSGIGFTVEGNGIAPRSITTNAQGFADIVHLEPGTYTVTADNTGLFDQDIKQVTIPERGGAEVVFTERPSLVISLWSFHGVGPGIQFPVELRIQNLSRAPLNDLVVDPLVVSGTGYARFLSGPTPEPPTTIGANSEVVLTYQFDAWTSGVVDFAARATGTGPRGPVSWTANRQVEVINELDAEAFAVPGEPEVDQPFEVRFRVRNIGPSTVSDVTFSGISVYPEEGITVLDGPPQAGSFTLGAYQEKELTFTLLAQEPGDFFFDGAFEGTTEAGTQAQVYASHVVTVQGPAPLRVTVTPKPAEFTLGERPDNRFEVDVILTNISDETLENVNITGGASPFLMSTLLEDPGVALELLGPLPDPVIGTLEPGQEVKRTYEFQALDVAHARVQVIALFGAAGEPTRSSVGIGTVKVNSEVFIEVSLKPTRTPNLAGQPMIIKGLVKNVTEDKTVGVVAFPTVEDNAANGILVKDVPDRLPGLPTGVQGWVLGPGESMEVTATVATTFAVTASDLNVSYFFMAWVHNDNDEKTQLRSTQIKVDREDGASDSFSARLAPADPPYDNPYAHCGFELWYCGLVVGVENFANSTLDLLKLAGAAWMAGSNYGWQMTLWAGEMIALGAQAVLGDPIAQEALRQEIMMDLQALIDAGALTLTQGQTLAPLVAEAMGEMIGEIIEVMRTGDEFAIGKFIGENPDMLIEGPLAIAKTLTTRKLLKGAVSSGSHVAGAMSKLDDARKAQVDEILARAGKTDEDLMKLLKAGDELNTDAIRKMWGVSENDIRVLQEIADKENITIAFRSRNPRSADLIEKLLAYEKPELLKIKTVSDVDMDWLGYPRSTDGLVVFMEPHPALKQISLDDYVRAANSPGSDEALRVRQAVDQAFEALDPKPTDPATINKVKDRMLQRAEEFAVFEPKLNHWQQHGIDVGYKPGSNAGENTMAAITDVRQLQKQALAGTPQPAWTIEITGRNNGPFKPVTGDIDITAIFGRDGKPITDPEQRARIIAKLREAIGMKHGESFTFRGPGREGYLEGAGKQVVIQKNQPPRVGEFVKRSSITEGTPHSSKMGPLEADDFIMLAGIAYEGRAATFWESMVLSPYINILTTFFDVRRTYYYGRQVWDKVVNGLASDQVDGKLNRNGSVAQPDGLGGVKEWVPASHNSQPLMQGLIADTGVRVEHQVSAGEWRTLSLQHLLARGGGKVVLAPQTTLFSPAPAGSTVLDVTSFLQLDFDEDSEWFEPGDQIVIDPGGPNEEVATVQALGSLVLSGPLVKDHAAGELVLLLKSPPTASNFAPVCQDLSSAVLAGTQLALSPACDDADGDALTYAIVSSPAHGTASVVSDQLVFTAGASTGPVTFQYEASDGTSNSEPATVSLYVGLAPTIAGAPPTQLIAGAPVQFSFTITGDPAPVVSLSSGQLPPGLLLSSAGVLSGTPSQAGFWSFSVSASNGFGADAFAGPFSIEVVPPSPPPGQDATVSLTYGLITPSKNQGPSALLLAGTFRLPQARQLACGQDVTISVGGYSETIPGSKFRRILHLCVYLGLPTASNYFVEFAYTLIHGTWSAAGTGRQVSFANFNGSLPIALSIGPDSGSVTGQFVERKGVWSLR